LPLNKNIKKIAVVGPNADDGLMQLGNYNGTPSSIVTILDGIKTKFQTQKSFMKKEPKLPIRHPELRFTQNF
jgi:beta-glucosidase